MHFHEVGAVDSIVDVVGGVIGLRWLRADRFVASPLNVGTGTVTMSHGTFPVPPPATARLVQGVPVYGAGEGELLTPTGALLVTAHATAYGPLPPLRLEAIGHGAGTRDTHGRPNVLRLIVGEDDAARPPASACWCSRRRWTTCRRSSAARSMERLLDAGALDAYLTPVQMKKGRPGVLITVLAAARRARGARGGPLRARRRRSACAARSGTARCSSARWSPVETAYGDGRREGRPARRPGLQRPARVRRLPARGGRRAGVPVKEVWAAAIAAWRREPAE